MPESLKQIIYTVLRVFFGTVLALVVVDLANLMNLHWADWKPVIVAGLAAALVVIGNALNWKDPRYGFGAGQE